MLAGLQREALRQRDWLQWVQRELPQELANHVTGVVEQAGALVIFAESAAWGVRLRYAAPQLLSAMGRGAVEHQRGASAGGAARRGAALSLRSVHRRGVRHGEGFHIGDGRVGVFFEGDFLPG